MRQHTKVEHWLLAIVYGGIAVTLLHSATAKAMLGTFLNDYHVPALNETSTWVIGAVIAWGTYKGFMGVHTVVAAATFIGTAIFSSQVLAFFHRAVADQMPAWLMNSAAPVVIGAVAGVIVHQRMK